MAKQICRKILGRAEAGNTCLQTPGTCESCPLWHTKPDVRVIKAPHDKCDSCGKATSKRKGTFAAPIVLVLGKEFFYLCMKCSKKISSLLDVAIVSIESKYQQKGFDMATKRAADELEKTKNDNFYIGFAVALGDLARRGNPDVALDIMNCNGVTLKQLREAGASAFDLTPLLREARDVG